MFKLEIAGIPAIFSKFFSSQDRDAVLEAVPEGTKRVVFLDTPATTELVATIESLLARDVEVIVRDHHDVTSPRNSREEEIAGMAARVRELVGANALISNRIEHPACSTLLEVGEFAGEGTVIVADPDPDGLTAAMKAVGVVYDGLDADAAVLDGPPAERTPESLTALALLLDRGGATLPPFDSARPEVANSAKGKLFAEFVAAVTGDAEARASLEVRVKAYEESVASAKAIVAEATQATPGVVMVDTVGKSRYDIATLTRGLEATPGCVVTVIRKDNGPVAKHHQGVQYSLAVVRSEQERINLQETLPAGFVSSPESGIISNTTFLLHVSQEVWEEVVLPALRELV